MVVAPPIVSQDFNTRTRLLSLTIRVVANARARVTANGRPSGTATTTIVTAVMKIVINSSPFCEGVLTDPGNWTKKRIIRATNKTIAAAKPSLAIPSAILFSFSCKGVASGSS
ncbi:hypothetical protein AWJ20_3885 [Sugiyamaella lignohabitans]|uniref:Uncharacterized protein n=1 Tax=Sugiyamaella lignohabitans TaxID=796027 RepID=A0A167C157_9ASCO|nr:uncharacterized protein AWJ20_3885 [Sugiyamaella lignohabitans]ANB11089.1 hypothetical protein AWJ20_3885 [Sugiyamaella lignohabitans]